MRKIILATLILAFTAVAGYSQTTTTVERNNIQYSGSAELSNGMVQIKYEANPAIKEVFVTLTPTNAYLELYVEKKESGLITVKCNNAKSGKFDYLIIVKRVIEVQGPQKQ